MSRSMRPATVVAGQIPISDDVAASPARQVSSPPTQPSSVLAQSGVASESSGVVSVPIEVHNEALTKVRRQRTVGMAVSVAVVVVLSIFIGVMALREIGYQGFLSVEYAAHLFGYQEDPWEVAGQAKRFMDDLLSQ